MPESQIAPHPFDLLREIELRIARHDQDAESQDSAVVIAGKLAIRMGSWHLLVPMNEIAEIIPMPRICPVPGVQPWLLGIANLRGTVISVVDLQYFLGFGPGHRINNHRVVISRQGDWLYGLTVDEVVGMRNFGSGRTVDNIDERLASFVDTTVEGERKSWYSFSLNRVLGDERFLAAADVG